MKEYGEIDKTKRLEMPYPETNEFKSFDKVNEYIGVNINNMEEQIIALPTARNNYWEELNKMFLSV